MINTLLNSSWMIQLLVGKYIPSNITFCVCVFTFSKGQWSALGLLSYQILAPIYKLLKYSGKSNQILCSVWFFQTSSRLTRYGKNGSINIGGVCVIQRVDHFSRITSKSLYHFPPTNTIGLYNLKYIPSFPQPSHN